MGAARPPYRSNGRAADRDRSGQAVTLGRRLAGHPFALVLTSPLSRAAETARLAGFGDVAILDPDLAGVGLRCPRGPADRGDPGRVPGLDDLARTMARRRDHRRGRRAARTGSWPGSGPPTATSCVIAHGHFLRVLAARWLELPPTSGALFALGTATISVLGWEHETPRHRDAGTRPAARTEGRGRARERRMVKGEVAAQALDPHRGWARC